MQYVMLLRFLSSFRCWRQINFILFLLQCQILLKIKLVYLSFYAINLFTYFRVISLILLNPQNLMSLNSTHSKLVYPIQVADIKFEESNQSNKFEQTTKVLITPSKNQNKPSNKILEKPKTPAFSLKTAPKVFPEQGFKNDMEILSYQSPQKPVEPKNQKDKQLLVVSHQQLLNIAQTENQRPLVFTPVKEHETLNLRVEKSSGFFNMVLPCYQVFAENSNQPLMNAKRISLNPNSTIVISKSKDNFEQKSPFYLGKIKSNVIGDKLNIFGAGLSPANAIKQNVKPRQLLATVIYSTRVALNSLPRFFKVYLLNQNVDYYSAFPQVKMYGDEIPLNQLYNNPDNQKKITVLRSKQPRWCKEKNLHILNFSGKAKIPCVNNFILEEQIQGEDKSKINERENKLLFAKFEDSKFHLDVSGPLDPFLAFCIATSNLQGKMFCE